MIDLKKCVENFDKFLNSEEGKKYIEDFAKKQEHKELMRKRYIKSIHEKFSSNIDFIIEKIINKYDSDKYKVRWYGRCIEPPETLYWYLYDYAEFLNQRASIKQIDEYGSEMFGGDEAYIVGSYFIQLIHGQGSAIIIRKLKNKISL